MTLPDRIYKRFPSNKAGDELVQIEQAACLRQPVANFYLWSIPHKCEKTVAVNGIPGGHDLPAWLDHNGIGPGTARSNGSRHNARSIKGCIQAAISVVPHKSKKTSAVNGIPGGHDLPVWLDHNGIGPGTARSNGSRHNARRIKGRIQAAISVVSLIGVGTPRLMSENTYCQK